MAKAILTSTENGSDSMNDINNNFTEVYTGQHIHDATEKTTPVDADELGLVDSEDGDVLKKTTMADIKATGAEINTGTDDAKFTTPKAIADSKLEDFIRGDGWTTAGETWTYASADAPTYTFTISGDKTGKYSAGMKVKLTQPTDGVKYGIITKVSYSSPNTTITLYMGTDYDLDNETITSPCYSTQKAPFGFPLDPDKWTVEVYDGGTYIQSSATADTYYNLGSLSLDIPIGLWDVSYLVNIYIATANNYENVGIGFGNNNNSLIFEWVSLLQIKAAQGVSSTLVIQNDLSRKFIVNLTTKQTYYLNEYVQYAVDTLKVDGGHGSIVLRARCAYL